MTVTLALMSLLAPTPAEARGACASQARTYGAIPKGAQLAATRALIHGVARQEGVDPYLLEAIGRTETGLRPALGGSCEVGHFQIMRFWAKTFGLASADLFWDLRVGATAAARILKHAGGRWRPGFAVASSNPRLRRAGLPPGGFDAYTFAAMTYNWGGAAKAFERSRDPRRLALPAGPCRYVVRFRRQLAAARRAGPAGWSGGTALSATAGGWGPSAALVYPVAGPARVVGRWGDSRGRRTHRGVDIMPLGQGAQVFAPVRALAAGTVIVARDAHQFEARGGRLLRGDRSERREDLRLPRTLHLPGYGVVHPLSANYGPGRTGLWVAVAHGPGPLAGKTSHYMHLAAVRVRVGQRVRAGEELGRVGSTAILSSRPHLHFGISGPRGEGASYRYVNPTRWLSRAQRGPRTPLPAIATAPATGTLLRSLHGLLAAP